MSFCHKHSLDPNWYQMWWLGLTHPNGTLEHRIHLYAPQFWPIFQSQQQIRWKQLYYGKASKQQWTHYLTVSCPDLNPLKILSQMVHMVWTYILELWESHNADQHHTTN